MNMKTEYTEEEAARLIHLSVTTLARRRQQGISPPYTKNAGGEIIYTLDDLEAYQTPPGQKRHYIHGPAPWPVKEPRDGAPEAAGETEASDTAASAPADAPWVIRREIHDEGYLDFGAIVNRARDNETIIAGIPECHLIIKTVGSAVVFRGERTEHRSLGEAVRTYNLRRRQLFSDQNRKFNPIPLQNTAPLPAIERVNERASTAPPVDLLGHPIHGEAETVVRDKTPPNKIEFWTTAETAERLRVTESCLCTWRKENRGPAYIREGRVIRYRPADVRKFERQSRVETENA